MTAMYVDLPQGGGIWLERTGTAHKPHVESSNGEVLLWADRWHVIFTPPGWKASKRSKRVVRAFSPAAQRKAVRQVKPKPHLSAS